MRVMRAMPQRARGMKIGGGDQNRKKSGGHTPRLRPNRSVHCLSIPTDLRFFDPDDVLEIGDSAFVGPRFEAG
jgi:hypothetical protein